MLSKEKILLSTRQPPSLHKLLTTAKFQKTNTETNKTSWIASIIKMVILKNVYLFLSNPKTNCWLGTIDALSVVTV